MPTVDSIDFDVQAFLLCDSCVRDVQTGKTSVQGIFDRIFAQAFPCMHPQATIYFRFQFDSTPTLPIDVSIAMKPPSGLRNISPPTRLNLPAGAERAEGYIVVQGMQFPEAGNYSFELLVNGTAVSDYTLTLERIGQSPSGTGRVLN
jgi:uncharacterized protein DUF6941